MAQSMHIAFESRREHGRTRCWTDYTGTTKNDLTGPERGLAGVDDDVGHGGGGARTESSTYSRSPAL